MVHGQNIMTYNASWSIYKNYLEPLALFNFNIDWEDCPFVVQQFIDIGGAIINYALYFCIDSITVEKLKK